MFCTMSQEDFDQRVKTILAREFDEVLDLGLLSEEALLPVITNMRRNLNEAFANMSVAEAERHLQHLQHECRETASHIVALADARLWN
jgi:hypothetical protein